MATLETPNPNHNRTLSRLPHDIINNIFSRLSVKELLQLRSVCKSLLSLISSPCFVKTQEMIMYNIFLRLPVKTLSILRSVCKSWLSVVSSRDFIKTHLSVSTNDPHFTQHRLILADWTYELPCDAPWFDLSTCSLYSLLHEPFTADGDNLCYSDLCTRNIVGYCNGLVLVQDWFSRDQLFLWNPCTRELRKLPKLDWICFCPDTVYAFCYDESNDDFKVFAVSPAHPNYNQSDRSRTHYEYKVSVYSLKCDCWTMIGDFPFKLVVNNSYSWPAFDDGKFANGSVHWIVTPELKKTIIVSLDITTHTYGEVLQPNFGQAGVYQYWTLGTFRKSLSVLCQFHNLRADFWLMNGCGEEVSWTKLFTIPYMNELTDNSSYLKVNPICISANGDVILHLDSTIVLYNSKDHTFKNLLPDLEFADLYVYPYVESLVSPNLHS